MKRPARWAGGGVRGSRPLVCGAIYTPLAAALLGAIVLAHPEAAGEPRPWLAFLYWLPAQFAIVLGVAAPVGVPSGMIAAALGVWAARRWDLGVAARVRLALLGAVVGSVVGLLVLFPFARTPRAYVLPGLLGAAVGLGGGLLLPRCLSFESAARRGLEGDTGRGPVDPC